MDLDLGTLKTLLHTLESRPPQAPELPPQSYQPPTQLLHTQPYVTSLSQASTTPCPYSQQALPYPYPASSPYLPPLPAATHSSFHSGIPSVPTNLSPRTPLFPQSSHVPTSSPTKTIYDLIGTLEPVRCPSQYFSNQHFPPTPSLVTSQLPELSSLSTSTSRSREDFDDDGYPAMPSKKFKLGSPPLTPPSAREGTPDLLVGSHTSAIDHGQGPSSRLSSLDPIQSGSSIPADRVIVDITDSPPSLATSRNASLTFPIEFAHPLSPVTQDPTQMKFAQALPILTRLVETDSFLDSIQEIKEKQEDFELRLKDERNRLDTDGKRAVKQAQSSGRSDSDIQRIQQTMDSDLEKFDRAALVRWDGLKSQQQVAFQNLGVPTFCLTTDPAVLKRQRQVLEIILGALNDRETTSTSVQDEEPS